MRQATRRAADRRRDVHADRSDHSALHRHHLRHGRPIRRWRLASSATPPSTASTRSLASTGRPEQRGADPGPDLHRLAARGPELRQRDVRRVDDDGGGGDRPGNVSGAGVSAASSTSFRPRSSPATTNAGGRLSGGDAGAPLRDGIDAGLITTVCTYPEPGQQPRRHPSAPCTVGRRRSTPTQVKTTCTKSDVTIFVATAACPASIPQSGTGPEIICTTTPTLGTPSATCAVGVDPASPFDTTTALQPDGDVGDGRLRRRPASPARPERRAKRSRCNLRPIDVLVADAGCVDGTDADRPGQACARPPSAPDTSTLVKTTKTVTTTPFSGAVADRPGRRRRRRAPARRTSTASAIRRRRASRRNRRSTSPAAGPGRARKSPCCRAAAELARRRGPVLLQDRPASRPTLLP